jgi:hypothetical protein
MVTPLRVQCIARADGAWGVVGMIEISFATAQPLWIALMPILVVALGATLTVILGAFAYRLQKRLDYRHEMSLHRLKVYGEYVEHIAEFRTLCIHQWYDQRAANLGYNELLKHHAMLKVFADKDVVDESKKYVDAAEGVLQRCYSVQNGHVTTKQDEKKDAEFGRLSQSLISSFRASLDVPGLSLAPV